MRVRESNRVIVEMPDELKDAFKRLCKEDLTDMSTKGRQLIADWVYLKGGKFIVNRVNKPVKRRRLVKG